MNQKCKTNKSIANALNHIEADSFNTNALNNIGQETSNIGAKTLNNIGGGI